MNKIAKEILEAMMLEQDPMMSWYLLSSFDYHLDDIGKVPKRKEKFENNGGPGHCTYFLPVGNFLGLMSCFLKWAKKSSTGEAA